MTDVLAAGGWRNNAEMIADIARLGWIDSPVLDLTYGLGKFWDKHRPAELVANDLDPKRGDFTEDARQPPHQWWDRFQAVVYDPPYRLAGRRDQGFDDRYGLLEPTTRAEMLELIVRGSQGAARCTAVGGRCFVKCQAMINGGTYTDQPRIVQDAIEALPDEKFVLEGRFYLITRPRKQPAGRVQRTPRNNVSQLVAFRRV